MTSYLLDTNVISETRKKKPHGGVLAWIAHLKPEQIFLSAVTIGELQQGVEITREQDPEKAEEIEVWIAQIEASSSILSMDSRCFREYARLIHGTSDTLSEDAMIAGTARVHGLTVATRNERDFAHFRVPVFNPFKYRTS
jgi:predicted nucleic acid-binding protein